MLRCSRQVSTIDDKFPMWCETEKSTSHTKHSKHREKGKYLGLRNIKTIQTRVMKKYIILTHLCVLVYTQANNSCERMFTIQRKIVQWMVHVEKRHFCRNYFKNLIYFPCSEYTFSLVSFIVHNINKFQTNSAIHSINMRPQHHHVPDATLMSFEKGK
jgi:hypothetical protein